MELRGGKGGIDTIFVSLGCASSARGDLAGWVTIDTILRHRCGCGAAAAGVPRVPETLML